MCSRFLKVFLVRSYFFISPQVMLSLEKVWKRCRATGTPFPLEFLVSFLFIFINPLVLLNGPGVFKFLCRIGQHMLTRCWLQSDNTVKELRNNNASRVLSCLLQAGVFRATSAQHLIVGHTHEDIDAIFSLCATCLHTAPRLETPMDIVQRIDDRVGPVFREKGIDFSIELLGVALWLVWAYFLVIQLLDM